MRRSTTSKMMPRCDGGADGGTLQEAERLHLLAALKKTCWAIQSGAAARLGMNRCTLHFRMKKLGIERPSITNEVRV